MACQSESSGPTLPVSHGFRWPFPCRATYDVKTKPHHPSLIRTSHYLEGPISPVFASSVRDLSRLWTGSLSHYRHHRNDEHLEALIAEALRFTGLHLENDLSSSPYWSKAPLARRVALLLFLVDRGVVSRVKKSGKTSYLAHEDASAWAVGQPSMASYLVPTLEFIAALQSAGERRARTSKN